MLITSSGPSDVHGLVGWIQDPNGRGTGGLILSCILTLAICVWSALHLNIPGKNESRRKHWFRYVRWVTLGIFVPELVVLAAWRQWTSARSLTAAVNGLLEDQESGTNQLSRKTSTASYASKTPGKSGWTSVHSHFAAMGGFAVDLQPSKEAYLPSEVTRLTLTTHGVLLLARCGHLPYLDLNDLDDKSKTDALAKGIVMLQASWMLASTLGRLIASLPVSLLEVNTLGHVLCALVIYLLWWSKPREVKEPVLISGDWTDKLCAYMYMSSRMSGYKHGRSIVPRSWQSPELSDLAYIPQSTRFEEELGELVARVRRQDTTRTALDKRRFGSLTSIDRRQDTPSRSVAAQYDHKPSDSYDNEARRSIVEEHELEQVPASQAMPCLSPSPTSTSDRRHRLTLEAVRDVSAVRERFKPPATPRVSSRSTFDASSLDMSALEPELQELVVPVAGNWPSDCLMGRGSGQTMGMALWFASMAYGGVHIAAWNEHFPTAAERYLWHFSAVYVASSGVFWFLLNIFAFYVPWAKTWFRKFRALKVHWTQITLLGLGATICGLCYIFARVFLVVEAFISLRRVPADVYATPDWTNVVPHL